MNVSAAQKKVRKRQFLEQQKKRKNRMGKVKHEVGAKRVKGHVSKNMSDVKTRAELRFIGVVEKAGKQESQVRVFSEFCAGLKGLADFSHIFILYWMHLRDSEEERRTLAVFPRKHAVNVEKGVFACRSPSRPNPIGLCVAELLKVEEYLLTVQGLDAIEGSPVIDIKPYLPRADLISNARAPEWTLNGPPT